jgi:hypothetical protein
VEPPWKQLPDLPRLSIGWRMGLGQEVRIRFYDWFGALDSSAQQAYRDKHPEPDGWTGYYQMIIDNP